MKSLCPCMAFPSRSTGSLPATSKEGGPSSSKSSFFNRFKKGLHHHNRDNNKDKHNKENSTTSNNSHLSSPPTTAGRNNLTTNSNSNGNSRQQNGGSNGISHSLEPLQKPENARRVTADSSSLSSPTTASVPLGALGRSPSQRKPPSLPPSSPPGPFLPPNAENNIKPPVRVDSEKRENLKEIRATRQEQRALSTDPKRIQRLSGQNFDYRHTSTSLASPKTSGIFDPRTTNASLRSPRATVTSILDPRSSASRIDNQPPLSPATDIHSPNAKDWLYEEDERYQEMIEEELEWRWILNLSMHFRERSDREKFFVTYAESPHLRHRITVSCDYRNAEHGSLEEELKHIPYQREKSARIYEAVRDSLFDIQFYPTITNLKLETKDGRLHVHVNEDINEIIHYPHANLVRHLHCDLYQESELEFDCHLSGFVYKVRQGDKVFIKKEIPGPDTIDEFLYEINALHALRNSSSVIRFGGLVVDERRKHVRGLLISYAPNGSLIDVVFNERGKLPWRKRERWARQIIKGLSEIHEEGFVQGDFTMSNMVLDENGDVKIIDINRRGCPIGWEPPEIKGLIESQQRIGMFIGVKSDVWQLGMVLWGLVYQVDEPEAAAKPLGMEDAPDEVPGWFRGIVMACLSEQPRDRPSAKELLYRFPEEENVYRSGTIPPAPIDVVVGDGQIVHVSSSSSKGSPTSLRINPRINKRTPLLEDAFVQSPMTMTPTVGSSRSPYEGLNGRVNGFGFGGEFGYPERNGGGADINGFATPSPFSSPQRGPPSSNYVPESPATDIVSSPPVKDDGEFHWEGYKIERIADPGALDEDMGLAFRIETLEDARARGEIANSISEKRGSKRFSRGSGNSEGVPDTIERGQHHHHRHQQHHQRPPLLPAFGRGDSDATVGYETPSEEFPPAVR
ncbi:hypothetical protein EYR41_000460 [Orbilia oligospora]|uniref:Uncharacterized protein n=1 Tax=Orbilia oligospora TaxID=2813651 RepID=A0A7C8KMA4_ORBOL|nr:hypothetical protein TWF751_008993 [Orbilia oligospora]TGJ73360.1 hypothetical protein EYR41_000460 [Orbilia oligospora]